MRSIFNRIILMILFAFASFEMDAQLTMSTIAGTGVAGYSGDGGAATAAVTNFPVKVAADANGNLYFSDNGNNVVRKIDINGVITTVAGNGTAGYTGDGGLATAATLNSPWGVACDVAGNIFIADAGNSVLRKIDANTGIITTVAGNGTVGYSGDGGPALSASFNGITGIAIDSSSNIYLTDDNNNRIRKIDGVTSIVTTIAGTGVSGFSGDGGLATSAMLQFPVGISVGGGNIYLADSDNNRIRKINSSGIITTIAGTGNWGYNGDGIPATSANLANPWDVVPDAQGNIYIADFYNCKIRKVDVNTGFISTYAGTTCGYADGPITTAKINAPVGICFDNQGNLIIVDSYSNRLRKVSQSLIPIPSICYEDLSNTDCNNPVWIDTFWANNPTINIYAGCPIKLRACNIPDNDPCSSVVWYQSFNGAPATVIPFSQLVISYSAMTPGSYVISFSVQPCQAPSQNATGLGYLTINVVRIPNYMFTANPNPACLGNPVTFVSDAGNQTLYPGSSIDYIDFGDNHFYSSPPNPNTGLTTFTHLYTAPGTYPVVLHILENAPCEACSLDIPMTVTVNTQPPSCSTPPVFNCGNNGQPIDMAPYVTPPGGVFTSQTGTMNGTLYTPYPGNQYGSNNQVVYNNGCGTCTTQITINPPICFDWQNPNNPQNLGGGTINSGSQTISGALNNPFYVYGNYTISGAGTVLTLTGQFLMSPGVSIHVTNNATLKIQNAWLHSCCNMWPGIVVDNGGKIDLQNGINVIEDAICAITVPKTDQNNPNGGKFMIGDLSGTSHTVFNKNTKDIWVKGTQSLLNSIVYGSFVYGATFTCRDLQNTGLYTNLNAGSSSNLRSALDAYPAAIPYPPTVTIAGSRTSVGIHVDNIGNHPANYLNVGTPGNNKVKNYFDNHDFGIVCLNATVRTQNNRFQFMKQQFSSLSGVGIFAKAADVVFELTIGYNPGNFLTTARNEFRDCMYGTHITNYTVVYHNGNFVQNSLPASLICLNPPCVNSGGFAVFQNSLQNNTLYEFTGNTINNVGRAIYLNNVSPMNNNQVVIQGNYIYQTISGPTNMVGAWVEYGNSAANNTGYVKVSGNSIRYSNNLCLYFRNINGSATSGVRVDQNPELSVSRTTSTARYAIGIENCPYAQVTNNPLIRTANNNNGVIPNDNFQNQLQNHVPFSNGIFYLNSPNTLTSCNQVSWLDADLFYRGACNNSLFLNNTFDQSQIGYWLDGATTIIGTQLDPNGNLPIGDQWGKYPNKITFAQTFVSNGALATNSPLYTEQYSNAGLTPQPANAGNQFFSAIPYWFGTPPPPLSIFTQPGMAQGCGSTNGGGNHRVGQVANLSSNLQVPLTNAVVDVSDNFHRKLAGYRTIKNDNNQVGYLNDPYLANFYNTSANTNFARVANAQDAIASGNISLAQSNINAMQPTTAVEQDFKTIQGITLNKIADSAYHFTPADSVALAAIANKCVFESGIAVTQARALLASITQVPALYVDDCVSFGTSIGQRLTDNEIELNETDFVRLYPNPNNGNFMIAYKLDKDAVLEVRDVQGKVVCKNVLLANQNVATIACENLENGVYLYRVMSDKFESQLKKLVIVK